MKFKAIEIYEEKINKLNQLRSMFQPLMYEKEVFFHLYIYYLKYLVAKYKKNIF